MAGVGIFGLRLVDIRKIGIVEKIGKFESGILITQRNGYDNGSAKTERRNLRVFFKYLQITGRGWGTFLNKVNKMI